MRQNVGGMLGFAIMALDGELGKVKDFYFDDECWVLRYLVVQTGSWLLGRKVLIAFASVKSIDCESRTFSVDLSCDQVRHSPDINTEKPVCRQHEQQLHDHYMLPAYWMSVPEGVWGANMYPFLGSPTPLAQDLKTDETETPESEPDKEEQHLRSSRYVTDYLVHAVDGEIGHVKDFIIDLNKKNITHLLIGTRNLLPGKKVLLATKNIERIEWSDSEVYVNVTRDFIINSPGFDLERDL
ncbi:MAG: PRC-barrel domain-containing protein [Victivallales bacterium]|nr:PRC-barrel domain-containing protein [Victivallales bacterium]